MLTEYGKGGEGIKKNYPFLLPGSPNQNHYEKGPGGLRIPTQIGHPFRFKSATYSVPIRPGIPIQTGHLLTKVSDAG